MGRNQHVTPHPEGGWQVISARGQRATVRTDTQAEAIQMARELPVTKNLNCLSMAEMAESVKEILTGMILIRPKAKQ